MRAAPRDTGRRRPWLLLAALGVAAFVVMLLLTLPASLLLRFAPAGVAADSLSGSVWRGEALGLTLQGRRLEALRWRCSPLAALAGRAACRLEVGVAGNELTLGLDARRDGRVTLADVRGQLPVEAVAAGIAPPGWSGQLDLDVAALTLVQGWPEAGSGRIVLRGLRAPGPSRLEIGSYELVLGEGQVGTQGLSGRLRDVGGPLRVRGTLTLAPNRSYLLQGDVAPVPGADPRVLRPLAFLGPADAAGRRPFAIEGSL